MYGAEYELWFGPEYDWRAKVTRCVPDSEFEVEMTRADGDWIGTRVGLRLEPRGAGTWVRFYHTGWPSLNEHYRISCTCWAMYLRILRRSLEHGNRFPTRFAWTCKRLSRSHGVLFCYSRACCVEFSPGSALVWAPRFWRSPSAVSPSFKPSN